MSAHRYPGGICPCGGGIQACAQVGRIAVWAVCVECHAEYTLRLEDGELVTEKIAPPNQETLPL